MVECLCVSFHISPHSSEQADMLIIKKWLLIVLLFFQLTTAVGNVKVEKTQFDYYNFRPEEPDMDYTGT